MGGKGPGWWKKAAGGAPCVGCALTRRGRLTSVAPLYFLEPMRATFLFWHWPPAAAREMFYYDGLAAVLTTFVVWAEGFMVAIGG